MMQQFIATLVTFEQLNVKILQVDEGTGLQPPMTYKVFKTKLSTSVDASDEDTMLEYCIRITLIKFKNFFKAKGMLSVYTCH
jgi:hypothetical protein